MQNTFKVECWQKKARGHILMDVPYFQSVLHAKICAKYQMWAFFWFWEVAHLISKCFLHVRMATFGQMQVL
jgi:hypothetical protein